uniref:Uncharacterized protein n=1 Tax=Oryza meridionalis TaxID=40149 RepID=A0A0E0F674_9ORYZ
MNCRQKGRYELARRIFPLCEDFVLVYHFVESRSHFKSGLVNHALAAALRAFLLETHQPRRNRLRPVLFTHSSSPHRS